jgi:hypothetical protein
MCHLMPMSLSFHLLLWLASCQIAESLIDNLWTVKQRIDDSDQPTIPSDLVAVFVAQIAKDCIDKKISGDRKGSSRASIDVG